MRLLFFIFFFLAAFSGMVSQQFSNLPAVEYGGINPSEVAVRLYEKADSRSRVQARLNPGDFATYLFSGETGKWHYVNFNGRELAVYGKRITLNYVRIAEQWVFSIQQVQFTSIVSGVLTLLMLFRLLYGRRKVVVESRLNQNKSYSEQYVNNALRQQKRQMQASYEQQISKHSQINQQLYAENEQLTADNHQLKQKRLDDLRHLKQELEAEAKKQYQPTLEGMRQSYNALESMHDRLKAVSATDLENARVFDVDLRHVNLDSLLKGRRFEQCIAKCMQDVMGYTIQSWTPDKGFLSGINVQANRDPDLLLIGPSGQRIAIECKYRKVFYDNKGQETIAWARMHRAYDYRDYGVEKGAEVFLALGVGGDAACPDRVYLAPITTIMKGQFSFEQIINEKKHFAISKSALERWSVCVKSGRDINERLSFRG